MTLGHATNAENNRFTGAQRKAKLNTKVSVTCKGRQNQAAR